MKVKIGDKTYDSNSEPIMIILSQEDKFNIGNMAEGATKFCSYPQEISREIIINWMDEKANEKYLQEIEKLKEENRILGEELVKSRRSIYKHEKFFIKQRIAIQLLLDHVDYTNGACSVTEMVGCALPGIIIAKAREALKDE